MRLRSAYVLHCLCGATVESHTTTGTCSKCGKDVAVEGWGNAEAITRHNAEYVRELLAERATTK